VNRDAERTARQRDAGAHRPGGPVDHRQGLAVGARDVDRAVRRDRDAGRRARDRDARHGLGRREVDDRDLIAVLGGHEGLLGRGRLQGPGEEAERAERAGDHEPLSTFVLSASSPAR
jgi:hypothetical protein